MRLVLAFLALVIAARAGITLGANNGCLIPPGSIVSHQASCTVAGATAGNGIVIYTFTDVSTSMTALSDSQGGTYLPTGPLAGGTGGCISWNFALRVGCGWYRSVIGAGSITVTVTVSDTFSSVIIFVAEVVQQHSSHMLDAANAVATTATSCSGTCVSVTGVRTLSADEAIFAAGCPQSTGSITAGSGFALIGPSLSSANATCAMEWRATTSITSYTTSLTFGGGQSSAGLIVATFIAAPTSTTVGFAGAVW